MLRFSVLLRVFVVAVAIASAAWWWLRWAGDAGEPVRIGLLFATSGPRAEFDQAYLAGALAAIDQINHRGGIALGRPLEGVVRDTEGDPSIAAREAEALLQRGAVALVGGTDTDVRRAISSVLESSHVALVCPAFSEGLDDRPSLITTGTLANQRVVPAASWAVKRLGRRVYLLSNEGLKERVAHAILGDHIPCVGGTIVGETILPKGLGDGEPVVEEILRAKPDVVISGMTLANTRLVAEALRKARPGSGRPPLVLWQLRSGEVPLLPPGLLDGDFLVASTFVEDEGADSEFRLAFAKHDPMRQPDARSATAAGAVHLIAVSVERSGGTEPSAVRAGMMGARVEAPGGSLTIDARARAAWKVCRVGRIGSGGITEVWSSDDPIRPRQWPIWRTKAEWAAFLADPVHSAKRPAARTAVPASVGANG